MSLLKPTRLFFPHLPFHSDLISYHFLPTLSASVILASFLFLNHSSHTPASGPLYLLTPQLVKLSLWLTPLLPSSLSSMLSLVVRLYHSKWHFLPVSSYSQHSLDSSRSYFSPQHQSDILNIYLFGYPI